VLFFFGIGHDSSADIEAIPAPIPKGDFKPIQLANPTLVTFDLETTDLSKKYLVIVKMEINYYFFWCSTKVEMFYYLLSTG